MGAVAVERELVRAAPVYVKGRTTLLVSAGSECGILALSRAYAPAAITEMVRRSV